MRNQIRPLNSKHIQHPEHCPKITDLHFCCTAEKVPAKKYPNRDAQKTAATAVFRAKSPLSRTPVTVSASAVPPSRTARAYSWSRSSRKARRSARTPSSNAPQVGAPMTGAERRRPLGEN